MKKIEEIIEMMKSVNPEIKMDYTFKKSLKNKLEVTSYAKLKNTKNKKVNVAESWFFSLKKTNKNIFEKPKTNFLKILSPLFVWAFVAFWFFNFYWNNLFITDKWWDFNYKIEKISEKIDDEIKIRPVSGTKIGIKETGLMGKKVEEKKSVQKIVPVPKMKKLSPGTGTEEINIQEENNNSVNTEITDILWNDEDTLNMEINYWNDFVENNSIVQDSWVSDEIFIPEISEFEDFCNSKKWKILNNICTYWELKCSLEDFQNNKCDKL